MGLCKPCGSTLAWVLFFAAICPKVLVAHGFLWLRGNEKAANPPLSLSRFLLTHLAVGFPSHNAFEVGTGQTDTHPIEFLFISLLGELDDR